MNIDMKKQSEYERTVRANVYKAGIESGYPECCVLHYIYLSRDLNVIAGAFMNWLYGLNPYQFVRCPQCRNVDPKKIDDIVKSGIPQWLFYYPGWKYPEDKIPKTGWYI